MDFSILDFVKLSSDIKTPTRATQLSVGLDIYSPEDYTIEPQSQVEISTGLQVKFHKDTMNIFVQNLAWL